jgi:MOSC domain-containing protein YiiM
VKASPLAEGVVLATHIWPTTANTPIAVPALDLDWGGAIGDRHHGMTMSSDTRQKDVFDRGTEIRNHRQLSVVDAGELAEIAAALGIAELAPGTIADNICTSGIAGLTSLEPMSRLVFSSGAVLMTGGRNAPCTIAGRMVHERYGSPAERFPKAAFDLRGVTAWVERPGPIAAGDLVRVLAPTGI